MNETIGTVAVLPSDGQGPLLPGVAEVSPETLQLVDREVRRIIDECYAAAVDKLREHRDQLETLSQALLERETLDEDDAYAAAGFDHHPRTDADADAEATEIAAELAGDADSAELPAS
jgi:cell division protease FtsH